ncbi:MAG: DUF4230 domain-containing protein [Planctomycetota bacterium]
MINIEGLIIAALGVGVGLLVAAVIFFAFLRPRTGKNLDNAAITVDLIAERVRASGKLIGLEVCAKEIATATKGWKWLPPLVYSPARLAMIFQFEKQYYVDLNKVAARDVTDFGGRSYQVILPHIEGQLRLTNVIPYDIQDGKVCGLVDVIQMKAEAQGELMKRAQEQAAELFETSDAGYLEEARRSVTKQLTALLALFDAEVDIVWKGDLEPQATAQPPVLLPESVEAAAEQTSA